MPTGYTAAVIEGDGIPFEEFAMNCARAFGALVTMRDDPSDAAIPDAFEPSPYYMESVVKSKRERDAFLSLTEAERLALGASLKKEAVTHFNEEIDRRGATKERLNSMLASVVKWVPPSSEHQGLKDFMVQQLQETIRFDGDLEYSANQLAEAQIKTEEDYIKERGEGLERSVRYSQKSLAEEIERCTTRTKWVQQLRQSLKVGA